MLNAFRQSHCLSLVLQSGNIYAEGGFWRNKVSAWARQHPAKLSAAGFLLLMVCASATISLLTSILLGTGRSDLPWVQGSIDVLGPREGFAFSGEI